MHKSEKIFLCDDTTELYQQLLQSAQLDWEWVIRFILTKREKRVIEGAFQKITAFHEARAAVNMSNSWGFIDTAGKVVIECLYEQEDCFNEGYAAVRKDSKWFHMYVGEFHDGQAFVTDGLPCIINDKGEFVFDGANSG